MHAVISHRPICLRLPDKMSLRFYRALFALCVYFNMADFAPSAPAAHPFPAAVCLLLLVTTRTFRFEEHSKYHRTRGSLPPHLDLYANRFTGWSILLTISRCRSASLCQRENLNKIHKLDHIESCVFRIFFFFISPTLPPRLLRLASAL